NEIKEKILGVKKDDLEKFGAVSETVARQMACGVRKLSGADIGVGITGIAGPDSDGTNKPVGLCFVAADYDGGCVLREIRSARKDRDYNRISASSAAFDEIRKIIDNL
ncbi:MAG: nicotinamide-nucleotide amidohydrolase family protein, partial [Clostridia bacterium]|nr:nicotinamide-nucleotide amidohydrolase family protein [Clostridia bacterium]